MLPLATWGQALASPAKPPQAFAPQPVAQVMIDSNHLQASLDTMHHVIESGDMDTLCLILEQRVAPWETVGSINTLPRDKQRALLSRIWRDEKIVQPAPVDNYIGSGGFDGMFEFSKQASFERMSYNLLGEKPPEFRGQLTQVKMDALAARLEASK